MLKIIVPGIELWDEANNEFISTKEQQLTLEHSLISLSKWESKWCKPFFSDKDKTQEETIDYIKCMTLTPNVGDDVYTRLSNDNISQIKKYIEAPMTATWFKDQKKKAGSGEQVTAEIIYYWMIALNIPHEFDKWHLNRLMTLIQVCNIKNQPNKKMSRKEIASQNAALNRARHQRFNTKG